MLSHLFRSLLPFENPIGFGASDFLELFIAAVLVCLVFVRPAIERVLRNFGNRTAWCLCLLAIAPVALRLLLLPNHPAPSPANYLEFSDLLAADTLRHFRLANPPHPLPQFFETLAVVQKPSYSSTATIGAAIPLAIGHAIFGHPWAGVLLSVAAFSSLSYWMLRAWTTPGWALAGGLLAVFQFGPLNAWTNGYAGGAASAAAACLVFGSLPRLRATGRPRDAALLGFGLAGLLLSLSLELMALAVLAPLVLLVSVKGLQQLSLIQFHSRPLGRDAAHLIVFLCAARFMFWYGIHLFENHRIAAEMTQYETLDSINHAGSNRHALINQQIVGLPGRQLVFVHYLTAHNRQDEWVYNAADIDSARTVWARDLGPSENQKLQHYYPDRSVWLLDPDDNPPKLVRYEPTQQTMPQPATPQPTTRVSPFETVH